jgi:hypothetical protein
MNILFILTTKALVLVKWSYRSPNQYMLTIEPKTVITSWACNLLSNTCVFWVFVLGAIPNHKPLKYRCLLKISNQIRHMCLMALNSNLLVFLFYFFANNFVSMSQNAYYSNIMSSLGGFNMNYFIKSLKKWTLYCFLKSNLTKMILDNDDFQFG